MYIFLLQTDDKEPSEACKEIEATSIGGIKGYHPRNQEEGQALVRSQSVP